MLLMSPRPTEENFDPTDMGGSTLDPASTTPVASEKTV